MPPSASRAMESHRPRNALALLDRASEFAPEVVRYRTRTATAILETARREMTAPDDPVAEMLWMEAAQRIDHAVNQAPNDASLRVVPM